MSTLLSNPGAVSLSALERLGVDKFLAELAAPFSSVIVTGTNGKSTTTRMVRAALESAGPVASNINGDNMTSGVITVSSICAIYRTPTSTPCLTWLPG